MGWLVIVCGAALAIGGAVSVAHGAPYWQIEFGWMEVIAGTTALAGGIVTMALGLILRKLGALQNAMVRVGGAYGNGRPQDLRPQLGAGNLVAAAPTAVPAPAVVVPPTAPEPAAPFAEPTEPTLPPPPAKSLKSRFSRRPGPEPIAEALPGDAMSERVADPVAAVPHLGAADEVAEPQSSPGLPSGEGAVPSPEGPFRRVGIENARVSEPEVIGRYQSGDASYILYADGTIDVETPTGTHRFASMEQLKAHIERQDSEETPTAGSSAG